MAWKLTIGDKSMLMDDLAPEDLVKACGAHENVNWLRLYVSPGTHPGALYDLLALVALKLETAAPPRPKNAKEAVALLNHLTQVEDDLPKSFGEGGIPLEAPGDPATTTSSTSTEPGSGTPNEPDPQA